jgi:hypothetical protein
MTVDTSASRSWGFATSGNYFDVLGIEPALGRFFHASDEHGPASAPFIVLSYDFWQRQFDGKPTVLGHTVQLNKHPFAVIGIAPKEPSHATCSERLRVVGVVEDGKSARTCLQGQ